MTALAAETLAALEEAAPTGLRRVAELRWVSEPEGAIRRVVAFEALKGARYTARWGFSVDFVPRIRGSRLAWKRTSDTADFDLCIDPVDTAEIVPAWCSFTRGDRPQWVRSVARSVRDAAAADFASVNSTSDLLAMFEERSRLKFRRFGLTNYVQTDLAWGLLHLAIGETDAGAERLARFCERFGVRTDDATLSKAKVEAARLHSITPAG